MLPRKQSGFNNSYTISTFPFLILQHFLSIIKVPLRLHRTQLSMCGRNTSVFAIISYVNEWKIVTFSWSMSLRTIKSWMFLQRHYHTTNTRYLQWIWDYASRVTIEWACSKLSLIDQA